MRNLHFLLSALLVLTSGCSWLRSDDDPDFDAETFRRDFLDTCGHMCPRLLPSATDCPSLCECRFREMHEGKSTDEFARIVQAELTSGQPQPTPAILGLTDRADLRCGGRLLRAGYVRHCTETCMRDGVERASCERVCGCSFDRIRQLPTPAQADQFYIDHLAGRAQPTPEGQRVVQQTIETCVLEFTPAPPN
jgi:hypothetical protein